MNAQTLKAAQALLIQIARIAWAMYQSFLASFTAFNARYTDVYGKESLDAVNAAAALPSAEEIRGVVTGFRNKVKASALPATNLWQVLGNYIEATFGSADWAAAKQEAGSAFYTKAARGNWPSLSKLLEAGTAFMVKYKDTLSAGGKGMPANFPDTFAQAKTDYETALQNFSVARQNAKLQTAARKTAYKAVHTVLLAMLKDAKRIFRFDVANQKAFTFAAIRRTVAPETSGVNISIKEAVSLLPVTTARLLFQPGSIAANTNEKGIASVKLKAGTYSATITMPGFETIVLNSIKVEGGTMHRIKLQAQKAASAVVA